MTFLYTSNLQKTVTNTRHHLIAPTFKQEKEEKPKIYFDCF